jgi:hypothetical protein
MKQMRFIQSLACPSRQQRRARSQFQKVVKQDEPSEAPCEPAQNVFAECACSFVDATKGALPNRLKLQMSPHQQMTSHHDQGQAIA